MLLADLTTGNSVIDLAVVGLVAGIAGNGVKVLAWLKDYCVGGQKPPAPRESGLSLEAQFIELREYTRNAVHAWRGEMTVVSTRLATLETRIEAELSTNVRRIQQQLDENTKLLNQMSGMLNEMRREHHAA